jgi:type IV secretory pathway TrbD component
MSAGMAIAIVITVLLLWLAIGGVIGALVGPLIKQAASRVPPSPEDHSTFSESPARSVSKT